MSKYFIDFEFIEGFHKPLFGKRRHFIDMISVGIYCEDGRTYFSVSEEYNYNDASDWVKENVIIPMYVKGVHGDNRNRYDASTFHKYYGKPNKQIADEIVDFINAEHVKFDATGSTAILTDEAKDNIKRGYLTPTFYGYYADYDWVLFCSLWGRMIDLPKGFPMYCIDLKQQLDEKVALLENKDFFSHFHETTKLSFDEKLTLVKERNPNYPKQENEHSAIDDAKWNYELYKFLKKL